MSNKKDAKEELRKINEEVVDNVSHPKHYADSCSVECIEAMLVAFGAEATFDFCVCNAFKYLWRYKNKNGVEDINKANWYVNKAESIFNAFSSNKLVHFDNSKIEKVALLRDLIVDKSIELDATKATEEKFEEEEFVVF